MYWDSYKILPKESNTLSGLWPDRKLHPLFHLRMRQ
jgi:hypothetical protein